MLVSPKGRLLRIDAMEMTIGQIGYQTEKYQLLCTDETPHLTRQWADVLDECRQLKAGTAERLRIALLNVDDVTRFELPFRLLLLRTPQLIRRSAR